MDLFGDKWEFSLLQSVHIRRLNKLNITSTAQVQRYNPNLQAIIILGGSTDSWAKQNLLGEGLIQNHKLGLRLSQDGKKGLIAINSHFSYGLITQLDGQDTFHAHAYCAHQCWTVALSPWSHHKETTQHGSFAWLAVGDWSVHSIHWFVMGLSKWLAICWEYIAVETTHPYEGFLK